MLTGAVPHAVLWLLFCHPLEQVMMHLRRQLSIAAASNPVEGTPQLLRVKQVAVRDALMGLGTVAMLCCDGEGGRVLYERAAHCCR